MLKKWWGQFKNNFTLQWIVYIFLALISFNLTNSLLVFVIVSIVGNILFFAYGNRKYNEVNLLTLLLCLVPLLGFLVFVLGSNFNLDPDANISIVEYICIFVGCISIPFLGFQTRRSGRIDIKYILRTIYCALALYMLINLIITLVHYGPFYTFIYADRYFFDYGHIGRLPVGKTAYMLLGIKSTVVTVEFFSLFASVLSSAILGVFFVSYKESKISFLIYLVCGSIGLLCILCTLNKGLIISYLALAVGFTLTILCAKKIIPFNKTTRIIMSSVVGLVGFVFVIFMLSAFNIQPIARLIEENAFFNKLFNTNRVIRNYHNIIRAMVDSKGYSGFTGYLIGKDTLMLSGSWLFDMFPIAQIFGWITFIIFVVVIFVRYVEYFKTSQNDYVYKILLLGIILGFLLISIAGYNSMPYFESSEYLPIFLTAPFLILLFVFGYIGENKEGMMV